MKLSKCFCSYHEFADKKIPEKKFTQIVFCHKGFPITITTFFESCSERCQLISQFLLNYQLKSEMKLSSFAMSFRE